MGRLLRQIFARKSPPCYRATSCAPPPKVKALNSIEIVTHSVRYFREFLDGARRQHRRHRDRPAGDPRLHLPPAAEAVFLESSFYPCPGSGAFRHSVNCYVRSVRIFFSWLVSEEIIAAHPFDRVKIPKYLKKSCPLFRPRKSSNCSMPWIPPTAQGQRNYTIILTLLDTGLRVSELLGLRLSDLQLNDGLLKVLGKGNKERLIPIGKQVQRLLWHYINHCRPVPAMPKGDFLFLTDDGTTIEQKVVGEDNEN